MPVPSLDPNQINAYNQQRRTAGQQLLRGKAQSSYQRAMSDLQFGDAVQDFTVDWGRRREELPGSFVQRGALDSGMYHGALKQYAQDRLRGLQRLNTAHLTGNLGNVMGNREAEDEYASTMYGSYGAQYADRATLAAQLREIL
jgi:hypothetical protein